MKFEKYCRKDIPPRETVDTIKDILNHLGINAFIKDEFTIKGICYSVRLEFKSINGLGVNGKGITKDLALASAYAEFMERLQSGFLIKEHFLRKVRVKSDKHKSYLGQNGIQLFLKESSFDDTYQECVLDMCKNNRIFDEGEVYFDILNNTNKVLPHRLINFFTHTNGLCSGNSSMEAISQGICEIFERYCIKEILLNNLLISNIKYNLEIIDKIEMLGFKCIIKDCTLNNKFPVIGIILLNNERDKYLFAVGADPDFNIAIYKCITEIFQGNDLQSIKNKMKNFANDDECINPGDLLEYFSNNSFVIKKSFIKGVFVNIPSVFKSALSTKNIYLYLLNLLKKENLNAYIKDLSFSKFYTYKVYIPTLSIVDYKTPKELMCYKYYNKFHEVVFNFKNINKLNIELFINSFWPLTKTKKFHFLTPSNYFSTEYFLDIRFNYISFSMLILYMSLKINNNSIAKDICKFEYNYTNNISLKNYYHSILYMIETNKKFKIDFSMPICTSCLICNNRKICNYKEWKKIKKQIDDAKKIYIPRYDIVSV